MNHITIGDISPRIRYIADGRQTVFSYPFPIFENSDLEVFIGDVRQSGGFTVTGAGNSRGGSLTFTTPPPAHAVVTLRRQIPVQRTTDFQEGGAFRAKVINDELDRMTAQIQQVETEAGRGIKPSPSDAVERLTLPPSGTRTGKLLGFNDRGELVAKVTPGEVKTASQRARDAEVSRREAETASQQAATHQTHARRYRTEAREARDETRGALQTARITKATAAEARAGTNNTKLMTPLRVKEATKHFSAPRFAQTSPYIRIIKTPGDTGHYYPVLLGGGSFLGDVLIQRHQHMDAVYSGGLLFDVRCYPDGRGYWPKRYDVRAYQEVNYPSTGNLTPQFIARLQTDATARRDRTAIWLRGATTYRVWLSDGTAVVSNAQGRIGTQTFGVLDKNYAPLLPKYTDRGGLPVGTIIAFSGPQTVPGWLRCNGARVLKSHYNDLYNIIGHTYALSTDTTANKANHFRVPDMRDLFIRGATQSNPVSSIREQGALSVPPTGWGAFGNHPAPTRPATRGRLLVGSGIGENREVLESVLQAGRNVNVTGNVVPRHLNLIHWIKF